MALRNTTWHKVEPGQIISFVYKSKGENRGYKRTIMLLNPDLKYRKKSTGRIKRYVVGMVLDTQITRPLTTTKVEQLFNRTGGLEVEEEALAANLPDTISKAQNTKLYNRLKAFVKTNKNYRTFDRRECLKRRVYLEVDYKGIPKDTLDRFESEQRIENAFMLED
jgi:hypothetical protein|tara:strand:+ start:18 stop:512 length:495 start_codon:yes stop_codon:yes gene_type:complete